MVRGAVDRRAGDPDGLPVARGERRPGDVEAERFWSGEVDDVDLGERGVLALGLLVRGDVALGDLALVERGLLVFGDLAFGLLAFTAAPFLAAALARGLAGDFALRLLDFEREPALDDRDPERDREPARDPERRGETARPRPGATSATVFLASAAASPTDKPL